jgi:RNA polymerase sigma-70 factor (ECF subfamily)
MPHDTSFVDLMGRLRQGESKAAGEIFQLFGNRLIGLARNRMDALIRQKVDPEDVMQSALKSFFLRYADGQFQLENWDSLWAILVMITLRKCGHRVEYFRAQRRDVHREVSAPALGKEEHSSWEAIAREPTPSEAAILAEIVETLLRELGDERERKILELSLQGATVPEISAAVGRSERTVQRVQKHIRQRLEAMRDQKGG